MKKDFGQNTLILCGSFISFCSWAIESFSLAVKHWVTRNWMTLKESYIFYIYCLVSAIVLIFFNVLLMIYQSLKLKLSYMFVFLRLFPTSVVLLCMVILKFWIFMFLIQNGRFTSQIITKLDGCNPYQNTTFYFEWSRLKYKTIANYIYYWSVTVSSIHINVIVDHIHELIPIYIFIHKRNLCDQ